MVGDGPYWRIRRERLDLEKNVYHIFTSAAYCNGFLTGRNLRNSGGFNHYRALSPSFDRFQRLDDLLNPRRHDLAIGRGVRRVLQRPDAIQQRV